MRFLRRQSNRDLSHDRLRRTARHTGRFRKAADRSGVVRASEGGRVGAAQLAERTAQRLDRRLVVRNHPLFDFLTQLAQRPARLCDRVPRPPQPRWPRRRSPSKRLAPRWIPPLAANDASTRPYRIPSQRNVRFKLAPGAQFEPRDHAARVHVQIGLQISIENHHALSAGGNQPADEMRQCREIWTDLDRQRQLDLGSNRRHDVDIVIFDLPSRSPADRRTAASG